MEMNLGSERRKAIEELLKGRDFATQLRNFIIKGIGNDGSESSSQLVQKVLMSFTNTLLLLNNNNNIRGSESHEVISTMQPAKSEDSLESNCKSSTVRDRRGCYKRRRTSHTWEKDSETPIEDGHQWRKYGQKVILNAKYPRNYYRCSHRFDQGCQATKQVQRVQEMPPLYKTTYNGLHTCKSLLNPDMILDSAYSGSSVLLSFDKSLPTPPKQGFPLFSSNLTPSPSPPPPPPPPPSVKKECKEETEISPTSSNNFMISTETELTFDNSTLESDEHKDVISDVLCDFVEIGDVFDPFV